MKTNQAQQSSNTKRTVRVRGLDSPALSGSGWGRTMKHKHGKRCVRCDGLMVQHTFFDRILFIYGWKCCNCGDVIDDKILENRTVQTLAFAAEAR